MRVYRHGDIIFREVKELPKGVVVECGNRFEQHGETGKMHVLEGVRVEEVGTQRFVTTFEDDCVVYHPEHPPLTLPPETIFQVERVRTVSQHQYVD
jgi:hypothetical protein